MTTLGLLAVLCTLSLASASAVHAVEEGDWEVVSTLTDGGAPVLVRSRRQTTTEKIKDTTKDRLTQEDRVEFLTAHNNARSIVSPTAANMPKMVWNATLENLAQRWALGCEFEHGQPDEAYKGKLGQNLWVGSGGYRPSGSVNSWDKEKADYTFSGPSCADGKVCGHYTQVVWSKSTDVGCGIAYCESMKGFKSAGYIIVCNYYKPGNFRGKQPYESGTPCSACPSGYSAGSCTNNLCGHEETCGGLKCADGETLDTSTCLCDCGADPDNKKGPFCGAHPGAAVGLTPCLQLLGAVLLYFML